MPRTYSLVRHCEQLALFIMARNSLYPSLRAASFIHHSEELALPVIASSVSCAAISCQARMACFATTWLHHCVVIPLRGLQRRGSVGGCLGCLRVDVTTKPWNEFAGVVNVRMAGPCFGGCHIRNVAIQCCDGA